MNEFMVRSEIKFFSLWVARKRDTERTQRDRNWAETQNFLVYWKTQIRENFTEILRRQKNGQMPHRIELTHFGFNVKSDHLVSPFI